MSGRVLENGPAFRVHDGVWEGIGEELKVHYNRLFDLVKCIPCPHWPPQAAEFVTRCRRYEWPSKCSIDQIVSKGCDVVHVPHAYCRDVPDTTQWRLSFSRAETGLIRTWTPVQKIIYHMLRYFRRKHFPKDNVLSSYHLKTLMFWNCEQRPVDYWKSSCLVQITSDLLSQLVQHIRERRLSNYFIPNCNLLVTRFDLHKTRGNPYHYLITKLPPFTHTETLEQWFLENYIAVAVNQFSDKQLHHAFSRLVSCRISERGRQSTLHQESLQRFISSCVNVQSLKIRIDLDQGLKGVLLLCSIKAMTVDLCIILLDRLPQIDHRLSDVIRSFVFMEAAYRIDQAGCLPSYETMSLIVEVLNRYENVTCLEQSFNESAYSYFNQALNFILNAKQSKTHEALFLVLAKVCLMKSLECLNSSSFFCAINAYLAAISLQTEDYEMTRYCIQLVVEKEDHSACQCCTMQPELLPVIGRVLDFCRSTSIDQKLCLRKSFPDKADIKSSQNRVTPEVFASLLQSYVLAKSCLSSHSDAKMTADGSYNKPTEHKMDETKLLISLNFCSKVSEDQGLGCPNSLAAMDRKLSNGEESLVGSSSDIYPSENTSDFHPKHHVATLKASRQITSEVKVCEYIESKRMVYSRIQSSFGESNTRSLKPGDIKLKEYSRSGFIDNTDQENTKRNFSKNRTNKVRVYLRVCSTGSDENHRETSNEHGLIHRGHMPTVRSFKMCYSRKETETNSGQLDNREPSKNIDEPVEAKSSKLDHNIGQQGYPQISTISATVRRSLINKLMEVSVNHMNTFHKALERDTDVSRCGIRPFYYTVLYQFKCGHFQDALDFCDRMLRLQFTGSHSIDAAFTHVLCSPPFCSLLEDEMKKIVFEYVLKTEYKYVFIHRLVAAAYMRIQCLVYLDKPASEVASALVLFYGITLAKAGSSRAEIYWKMCSHVRKQVLQRYRGRITEHGPYALLVTENRDPTVPGVKNSETRRLIFKLSF